MRLFQERFDTEAEARAFIAGVELVNDSDVACHEPRQQWVNLQGELSEARYWWVFVHDWCGDDSTDVCPLCGAGGEEDGLLCDHAQDDLDHRVAEAE